MNSQDAGTDLLEQLRHLGLPQSDFAIFGSGPLFVRGIIPEINDLDVLCRGEAWLISRSVGTHEYLAKYETEIVSLHGGMITIGRKWGIGNFDTNELIDTAEIIDDLPFVRLQHVVNYKNIRGSEKDLNHLALLEESASLIKAI